MSLRSRAVIAPRSPEITAVFQPGLFEGKVLFCTGGGSGICKVITEAIVRFFFLVLFILVLTIGC
jgi:hypothetical protein